MYLAKLENGRIAELFSTGNANAPAGCLPLSEEVAALCIADGKFGVRDCEGTYYPPPESTEQVVARYVAALDVHLNAKAREKGYDSIHTAALRAGYPGPFHAEGVAYASWMDACYALGYQVLAEVTAGTRQQPTVAEFVGLMPVLVLP